MGKGGVGKTVYSKSLARELVASGKRILLCELPQVFQEKQTVVEIEKNLFHMKLNSWDCFKEYIGLKLPIKALQAILLSNNIIRYLERAAPGVREIVLIGKIWYELKQLDSSSHPLYDHIIVDMPSTGYALTILNTPFHFASLFPGGPIYSDSKEMIATFSDKQKTSLVVVSLAEEMPAQESIDFKEKLRELFPLNPPVLVLNRLLSDGSKLKLNLESPVLKRSYDHLQNRFNNQQPLIELLKKEFSRSVEIKEGSHGFF